jgi:phosphatidylserine/phosphatidylglycerophosphate/cardiolipin synthase-like enzyme
VLDLGDSGWQPTQIAYLVDQIIAARKEEERLSHLLDLVISGPETSGVTMRATGAVFQELISNAENEILMASFAIYNGQSIFKPLVQRWKERPDLSVKLFLDIPRPWNDTTLDSALVARYRKRFVEKEWPGETLPELYHFLPALESDSKKRASMHAKIVVVDRREVFVSSANFTNAAQTKNIEIGVRISNSTSASRLHEYFLKMFSAGQFRSF